jgi:murein L,D-transpeptidase YcbB/YkuD
MVRSVFHTLILTVSFLTLSCQRIQQVDSETGQKGTLITRPAQELVFDSSALESALKSIHDFPLDTDEIRKFYRTRNYRYAWFNSEGWNDRALSLGCLLSSAMEDGVRLKQSDPSKRMNDLVTVPVYGNRLLESEVDLTARYFEYANAIYVGLEESQRRKLEWYIPAEKKELEGILDHFLNPKTAIDKEQSLHPQYNKLKSCLRVYSSRLLKMHWTQLAAPHLPLRQGDVLPVLDSIRQRLALLKDLESDTPSMSFDSVLEEGVRHFQARHGLQVNGCIDRLFIDELNVTPRERIRQIMINMERCRWLPLPPDSRFIVINIPAFRLLFYDRKAIRWKDDIIVGKEGWNTTVFAGKLSSIVFNPYWVVPNTILAEELLDKIITIPDYLQLNHFEVVTSGYQKKTVNPDSVDWRKIDPLRFPYELRQLPGAWNALGKLKFVFPNSYSIYLHDTPSKGLFDKAERTFSHGCIRVAHAEKLAELLLENMPTERFRQLLREGYAKEVKMISPVPVFIVYFTAWVDDQGRMNFRKDIYGHDKRLGFELFGDSPQL